MLIALSAVGLRAAARGVISGDDSQGARRPAVQESASRAACSKTGFGRRASGTSLSTPSGGRMLRGPKTVVYHGRQFGKAIVMPKRTVVCGATGASWR